jgi:hypothetical protein
MSNIKPFNKLNWLKQINYNDNIDYFFTQRKVVETTEYVDESTLERKEKKENITHNFLAINLPVLKEEYNKVNIEVWGDKGYNYEGCIINYKGNTPNLILKLLEDTEIFVKLIYKNEEKENDNKTYISFINVLKRYQK